MLPVTLLRLPRFYLFTARFMTNAKVKNGGDSSNGKSSYLGMTGTQLNIWVTVACTTAMTLFGEMLIDLVVNRILILLRRI